MTEYIPANASNFKVGRDGNSINKIIIHTVVGSLQSAITTFQNPSRIASAHYIVGLDGRIVQMVKESDTAYHAGNWQVNLTSIGIEHADNMDYNGPRTPELYEASARLVLDICKRYNIPIDRQHILRHREVSLKPTACPDNLDIDRIVARANQINTPPPPPPPDWQVNRQPIGSHVVQIQKDVSLINLSTGDIVKTFPAGSTIEVAYRTSHAGVDYYQTQYSAEHNAPNAFPVADFDYVKPAPEIPPEAPVKPSEPVLEPTPTTEPSNPETEPINQNNVFVTFITFVINLLKAIFGKRK